MEMAREIDAPASATGLEDQQSSVERRIAGRLAALRAERGWTLEAVAQRTGISRATLSRLERCELSPTAAILSNLCGQYGWTLSRLMAEAEQGPPSVIRASEQVCWQDPETGYIRRVLSPPTPNLKGEMVVVTLPPHSSVSYEGSYVAGLEHHLWMLEGVLSLEIHGTTFQIGKGDCIRYVVTGPSKFLCGKRPARYVISMVRS
jgi:transcriptional regulator with XRE-family HTH domain